MFNNMLTDGLSIHSNIVLKKQIGVQIFFFDDLLNNLSSICSGLKIPSQEQVDDQK